MDKRAFFCRQNYFSFFFLFYLFTLLREKWCELAKCYLIITSFQWLNCFWCVLFVDFFLLSFPSFYFNILPSQCISSSLQNISFTNRNQIRNICLNRIKTKKNDDFYQSTTININQITVLYGIAEIQGLAKINAHTFRRAYKKNPKTTIRRKRRKEKKNRKNNWDYIILSFDKWFFRFNALFGADPYHLRWMLFIQVRMCYDNKTNINANKINFTVTLLSKSANIQSARVSCCVTSFFFFWFYFVIGTETHARTHTERKQTAANAMAVTDAIFLNRKTFGILLSTWIFIIILDASLVESFLFVLAMFSIH